MASSPTVYCVLPVLCKLIYHIYPLSLSYAVYAECSNHGICDRVSGVCACERGFKGDNCFDTTDNEVRLHLTLTYTVLPYHH